MVSRINIMGYVQPIFIENRTCSSALADEHQKDIFLNG